ncbi:MAG TPA: hypothetical protein VGZ47_18585 [Gemmataceae bacterium]|jgi:hypothetical protein|nr:hypothetical protein [Gemmataceae bacterium]
MSFAVRAVISLLAGIGAGAVGFWVAWRFLLASSWQPDNLVGFNPWMLVATFAPGILVCVVVFWTTSPKTAETGPASAQK